MSPSSIPRRSASTAASRRGADTPPADHATSGHRAATEAARRGGWRERLWLTAPVVLALTLWLALPRPGVWLDEAATVSATSRSWGEMMHLVTHQDASLSGYYAAVWATSRALHLAPLTAGRLLSGLAFVTTTALVAMIGRRLGGQRLGLVAGLAVALMPSTSAAAVNARPEALATALVAATCLAALRGRAVAQMVFGLLACWVYALTVLYLPLVVLLWFAHGDARPAARRPRTRTTLAAGVSSVIGIAWLLLCSRQQAQVSWIHTDVLGDLTASFTRVGFTAPLSRAHEQPALTCCIVLGIASALVAATLVAGRATRRRALVLWLFALTPPLVATALRVIGKDVFVARYFTPSSIGIALVLGLAATRLTGTRLARRGLAGAAVVATVLSLPVLWASHLPDGHWGERLGVHADDLAASTARNGDTTHVWFVAPHNRAVLFTGRLDGPWRGEGWWDQARRDGTLWGPPAAPPSLTPGTWTIVSDTRRRPPTAPATCVEISRTTEARATSVVLRCR